MGQMLRPLALISQGFVVVGVDDVAPARTVNVQKTDPTAPSIIVTEHGVGHASARPVEPL